MQLKITYYPLIAVLVLLFSSSLRAQFANTAAATLATWPSESPKAAARPIARSTSNAQYVLMQGQVTGEDWQPVEAFHMDLYKLHPDGRRVLVRTSPHPNSHYKLYLESGSAYELIVQANGYDTKTFYVEASEEDPTPIAVTLKARPTAPLPQLPSLTFEIADNDGPIPLPDIRLLPEMPAAASVRQPVTMPRSLASPARRLGRIVTGTPLRRGLRQGDKPLLQLPAGAQVDILERTTPSWWMVEYHGEIGWVRTTMIE